MFHVKHGQYQMVVSEPLEDDGDLEWREAPSGGVLIVEKDRAAELVSLTH